MHTLFALASVPVEDVESHFGLLRDESPEDFVEILDYLKKNVYSPFEYEKSTNLTGIYLVS